jgi:hypothetical protein
MEPNQATSRIKTAVPLLAAAMAIAVAASTLFAQTAAELAERGRVFEDPDSVPGRTVLSSDDEQFLDELQQRGIRFFIDEADPVSGLMPDRSKADGGPSNNVSSIASVGFGVTALCIGVERGWVPRQEAYDRCLRVLKFLRDKVEHHHGHFYHFMDMRTGKRVWECEVSNIDTALLMCGVLTVRQYFPDTELAKVANDLFERVEWGWLLDDTGQLHHGFKPESGLLEARWGGYSEGPVLIHLLGMGSRTHALPAKSWHAWKRDPVVEYAGLKFIQCPPLFTHQFPQCWFDLRGLRDDHANYFRNARLATIAMRQWTIDELSKRFPKYGPDLWGLTASDYEGGYTAWGGPPAQGPIDGSLVPCAAAGSLAFEPRICLDTLKAMHQQFADKAWKKYGFVDAFNPAKGWYNADVIGIDVGPTVVMAENCRSGFVWKVFMSAPEAQAALKAAGMRPIEPRDSQPATTSIFNTAAPQPRAR